MTHVDEILLFLTPLRRRHNGHQCVSNHRQLHCMFDSLFCRTSKKTSKPASLAIWEGNPLCFTGDNATQKIKATAHTMLNREHSGLLTVRVNPVRWYLNPLSENLTSSKHDDFCTAFSSNDFIVRYMNMNYSLRGLFRCWLICYDAFMIYMDIAIINYACVIKPRIIAM